MSIKIFTTLVIFSSIIHLHAASRPWKSPDGKRTIQGEFIKRDPTSLTIQRTTDRKEVVIPVERIHPDDQKWLDTNHPLPEIKPPPSPGVFDTLSFGQTRAEVLDHLKTSKFVELTVDETFLGRTGLNDVFRTRKKIGELNASLFFDWTENNTLKEITLQTKALPESALNDQLVPCWKELATLLTTLYGKPIYAIPELHLTKINDGTMFPTHLWNLEKNGSASLGAARDGDHYQVCVRFTEKTIKPFAIGIP